jgi:hypothetical protein
MNVRCFNPLPHVFEHPPHSPQPPTQSSGQSAGVGEQSRVSVDNDVSGLLLPPHCAPPCCASTLTEYDRTWWPSAPQLAVHTLHSCHSPTQSIGHDWLLQVRLDSTINAETLQATPPNAAAVSTSNVRDRLPPPQLAVQSSDHELHSPSQSTGHWTSVLHDSCSSEPSATLHARPPKAATCIST